VRDQVAAFVGDGNVHGLSDLFGLLFSGGNYSAGIFQCHSGLLEMGLLARGETLLSPPQSPQYIFS
jgi:hypothetical protein